MPKNSSSPKPKSKSRSSRTPSPKPKPKPKSKSRSPQKSSLSKLNIQTLFEIPEVREMIFDQLNKLNKTIKSGVIARGTTKILWQELPLNKMSKNKKNKVIMGKLEKHNKDFMYNCIFRSMIQRALDYTFPGKKAEIEQAKKYMIEIEERIKNIVRKINKLITDNEAISKDTFYDYIDNETDYDTWEKGEMSEFFKLHESGLMNFPKKDKILKCMKDIRDEAQGIQDYNQKNWKWTFKHNGMTEGISGIYKDVIEPYRMRNVNFLTKR